MPAAVMVTLALLALALAGMLMRSTEKIEGGVAIALLAFGLATRHPAGWALARVLSLLSIVGTPLFVWLSLAPARAWFGLNCPACGGDARPVLAQAQRFGCLKCGSAWISR
jgi:hypothetical protein